VVSLNPYRSAHIRTLSRSELADVLALLEVLAGLAARLAAERIGRDGNRMRVQAALQDPADAEASDDVAGVAPACDRFFRALLLVAANRDLARLLPTLQVHLLAIPAAFEQDVRYIAEAVLAGDAEGAEGAARRHFRALAEHLRRLPTRRSRRTDE